MTLHHLTEVPAQALVLEKSHTDHVVLIFEFYKHVLNHPRACLDMNRNLMISRALGMGYDLESLCLACYGCSLSSWHMGRDPKTGGKKFTQVSHIFETADRIDALIEIAEQHLEKEGLKEQRESQSQEMSDMHISKTFTPESWKTMMAEIKARIG